MTTARPGLGWDKLIRRTPDQLVHEGVGYEAGAAAIPTTVLRFPERPRAETAGGR